MILGSLNKLMCWISRLFKARNIYGAAIINGDVSGIVIQNIGKGLSPVELIIPWTELHSETASPFNLLSWKTRLVENLIGRTADRGALMAWACDDSRDIAVRFLTGAGGAGKSRLAAEVATGLRQKGWNAGFIDIEEKSCLSINKAGLFLIVDYPEERQEKLYDLLRTIGRIEKPPAKLRVLLLSRQPKTGWDSLLAQAGVRERCDIQEFFAKPLDASDICDLVQEAFTRLAKIFKRSTTPPNAAIITAWHARNPAVHGLPLFASAAAIHAAQNSTSTFDLSGSEIIAALVQRERRRLDAAAKQANWPRAEAASRLHALAVLRNGLDASTLKTLAQNVPDLGAPPADRIIDKLREQGWWDS